MRRVLLTTVVFFIVFSIVPIVTILTGEYNWKTFFSIPPSAKLEAFHCDHNVQAENGMNTMRLTSVIKTHNMAGITLSFSLRVFYKDGTPVLSSTDEKPIEKMSQIKIFNNDTIITEISRVEYALFPSESFNKDMVCQVFLAYKNEEGDIITEKQSEEYEFKGHFLTNDK